MFSSPSPTNLFVRRKYVEFCSDHFEVLDIYVDLSNN